MTFIFILGYPNPCKGALRGGLGGLKGVLSPILPHIMCYVNSGVFNSGESKNDLCFLFGVTPNPTRAPSGGGLGGLQGVLSPIQPNIMCYVNSGVFNSGKSKNDLYFHFRVTPTPTRAPSGGRAGGPTGDVESYSIKYHVLCQFWGFQ